MKQPKDQRFHSTKPIVLLLFMLMFTLPLIAQAAPFNYMYKGLPFSAIDTMGLAFPDTFIIIRFTLDPGSGPGSLTEPPGFPLPFTIDAYSSMNAGLYKISAPNYDPSSLDIAWDATGQITSWYISASQDIWDPAVGKTETETLTSTNWPSEPHDSATINDTDDAYNTMLGSWNSPTPPPPPPGGVPEPSTLFLLVAGLSGLWVWGRRKFNRI